AGRAPRPDGSVVLDSSPTLRGRDSRRIINTSPETGRGTMQMAHRGSPSVSNRGSPDHRPTHLCHARRWKGQMLTWLKNRLDQRQKARSLYGSIVTQARSSSFYASCGVPETGGGRFEMIALHLVLVLHRLADAGAPGRQLGQAVTEAFVNDLDDSLREMTVGDLAVPRHVKRAVGALHDRHAAYREALAAPSDAPLAA